MSRFLHGIVAIAQSPGVSVHPVVPSLFSSPALHEVQRIRHARQPKHCSDAMDGLRPPPNVHSMRLLAARQQLRLVKKAAMRPAIE